jgi:signal transduction histidine kinase
MEKNQTLKCWEYFECSHTNCPAHQSDDHRCWLFSETYCHNEIQGTWIEKMGSCLNCPVYEVNFSHEDLKSTLTLISNQFSNFQKRVEEDNRILKENRNKLQEFKITSSYLLKELDKKSQEVLADRKNLEIKVKERTKELENMHTKLIQTSKIAVLGRFSAGIAHEINNPLGAIMNYARTLLANPDIKKKNRDYMELILKGLFRIESIVRQILSYSRYQKSDLQLSSVNEIIKDAIEFVHYKQQEKEIKLKLTLEKSLQPILLNSSQIQQVFINVINNAFDAIEQKGELIIETSHKNGTIIASFIDKGKGIPKEDLGKIFDPFYTTKDVGKGTGLGLFISYNILKLYDGSIDIESKEGEGTEVIITFPVPENK